MPKTAESKIEKPKSNRLRTVALFTLLVIPSLLFLIFGGAVFAYHSQYQNRAMAGQEVLGIDVGGKSASEIKRVLDKEVSKITFYFNVDEEQYKAVPADAGVTFNTTDTAEYLAGENEELTSLIKKDLKGVINKIFGKNRFVKSNTVRLKYRLDRKKLSVFSENLSTQFSQNSKNAGLVIKGTEIQVIPAVAGRKIVTTSIEKQIESSLSSAKELNISVDVEKINPKIIEADTMESINQAKVLFNLPVVYTYKEKSFRPEKETVASWIIFNTKIVNGKEKLIPAFDARKIYPYIYNLSSQINIPPVNKKVVVKNGAEQIVEQEGKPGLSVDVDLAAFKSAKVLSSGKALSIEIPTYSVRYKTNINNVVVANWEKYITVDISEQRMCAYLSGGVQVRCASITTGATSKGYYTPTGTFLIQRKAGAGGRPGAYGGGVCMPNPPSTQPLCGINYVSYFTSQGHAFHEAWWRTSFGTQSYKWNGSHGCVNAPYELAKYIYFWAPIGTPVIISN